MVGAINGIIGASVSMPYIDEIGVTFLNIPYGRKVWRELNLADWL